MPTTAKVANENIPAVPTINVQRTLIAAYMQKIETTEIKEFERRGVINASNNNPIVHHRGFLSNNTLSLVKVFGLCKPRH